MAIEVFLPAAAGNDAQVTLTRWLKSEGDAVTEGEVLAEVESDKAVLEIVAPATGILGRILVTEGSDGIAVQTPLAVILPEGETLQGRVAAAGLAPVAVTGRILASPLARRSAYAAGVELSRITGTGPNGRVIRADVEALLVSRPQASPEPAPAAESGSVRIPHTTMRRVIAERLSASKRTIPHFYLSVDCGMDALTELRAQLNAGRQEPQLSINDFVIKAAACALREVPRVNASWSDEYLVQHPEVEVAVAVATDSGLITPIIRDADQKSLAAISTEIRDLAARARQGRLLPQEYQGGSFTVSNLGMYGVREFAAIINPPQACILAVGATERRPVVRGDSLAVGWVMSCTLSADHRVVDGVIGAQFLAAFRRLVEQPRVLVV